MKQLCLAIPILLWAASAAAAPVLVRSGEHGSFTRIVVDTDPSVDWRLQQDGRKATLQLPRNPDGFSLSGVFRRITRDRLQNISSDGGTLTLELACDCVLTATSMAPNYIILDIAPGTPADAPAPRAEAAARPLAPDWSDSISATERFFGLAAPAGKGAPRSAEIAIDPPDPAAIPMPATPVVLPLVPDPAQRRPFQLGDALAGEDAIEQDTALTLLEDRLAKQIGLAATQGLLKPAPDRSRETRDTTDAGDRYESEPYLPEATLDPLMTWGGQPGNLRISSSVEDGDMAADSVATTIDGLTCAEGALFAVQDWGGDGVFGIEIARHRNALYGEFDKLDRAAQIALARAYIHFGFGAEALQIASLELRDEPVDAAIMVIARLLEKGPGPKTQALNRFAECDSDVAFWAILADTGQGQLDGANTAAALRALNKLPIHLRSFLAPELSKRLRLQGHADAAAQAMRSIARAPHEPEGSAKLEQAEIDLANGNDRKAGRGFEEVIAENSFEAPRALIRFIDLQVDKGEAISSDTALLAEAYAAEYRDSELAPEITRAHMMALAKSGQFDAAFDVLETARTQRVDIETLMTGLYETLQTDADNVAFLKRALALDAAELSRISERTRILLGKRLLALGFSRQAEAAIAQVDRTVAPREQQLLRGRIHLALGHHRQALAASATFTGDEFASLRADALYASGEFAEAAEIYASLGDAERAASAAWKAPTGTVTVDDSGLADAADLARRAVPEAEGGLLAKAGALLSDSSALGTEIEQLLANPELNIGADG